MSSGLNMSLDDLIKQSKSRPKANPAFSSGPTRRAAPSARTMPYPPSAPKAATADSLYGVYSEHVAAMATSPPPPVAGPQALETGTKLHISNLDSSVTVEDVQGSAEVVFARKVDALDAIERYNGVLLDGKPMKIELIGNKTEPHPTEPLMYNGTSSNYNATPNSLLQRGDPRGPFHGNGRSGGSGQGGAGKRGMFQGNVRPGNTVQDGGGRGQGRARGHDRSRVPASAADLDAELEQYHAAAVKQK
ncbi:hypothetical protein CFC21_029471 [Triticum aestivum]|uniref:Chromatin target of PRMT1 protein C-terminal domain-containing protein n=2 Tax=Triticum aestivum TaxID=4565 RepID=A0A9R1JFK1_WHEAT|nr:hypothetical protein CFC21_029471 [Triticum aestivum]